MGLIDWIVWHVPFLTRRRLRTRMEELRRSTDRHNAALLQMDRRVQDLGDELDRVKRK